MNKGSLSMVEEIEEAVIKARRGKGREVQKKEPGPFHDNVIRKSNNNAISKAQKLAKENS